MKRAGRSLFNLAVVVSIVLWLAAAVAWPVSYWRSTYVPIHRGEMERTIMLTAGRIMLSEQPPIVPHEVIIFDWDGPWPGILDAGTTRQRDGVFALGFIGRSTRIPYGSQPRYRLLAVPFWFLQLALAWPLIGWIVRRQQGPPPPHHCKQCGYDLRATPDRCPECGAVPSRKEPASV